MTKHLIITADDYGPHWFINQGILDAVDWNIITTVSVFSNRYDKGVNLETALDALIAKIGDKPIGIGCHLTLTSGKPLTAASTLKDKSGHFRDITGFHFSVDDKHLAQVDAELEAQIKRLDNYLTSKGKMLDHVSCHHGIVGLFGPYNDCLVALMKRNGWNAPVRNPFIISKDKRYQKFKKSEMKLEGLVNALKLVPENKEYVQRLLNEIKPVMMKLKGEQFRLQHIPMPTYLFDNYYKQASAARLQDIVNYFPYNGQYAYGELMVHLGAGDADQAMKLKMNGINSDYFKDRIKELNILRTFIDGNNIPDTIKLSPMRSVPVFRCVNGDGTDIVYAG